MEQATTAVKATSTKLSMSDKALYGICVASTLLPSLAQAANGATKDPLADWNDYKQAQNSSVGIGEGSGIQNTLGNAFNVLKVAFVLIGFGLFGAGVMRVIKASKTDGQQSQAPGWIMIALGSFLSVAGFLFFAFGQGIQDSLSQSNSP